MNGFSYILMTLGITTQEISSRFGVSPSLISHMKRGDRNMTKKHEQILHSLTGIPVYYYNRILTRMDRIKIEEALLENSEELDHLNSLENGYNELIMENAALKEELERYKNRDVELLSLINKAL